MFARYISCMFSSDACVCVFADVGSQMDKNRRDLLERGHKLSSVETKTAEMAESAKSFSQTAHELANYYKNWFARLLLFLCFAVIGRVSLGLDKASCFLNFWDRCNIYPSCVSIGCLVFCLLAGRFAFSKTSQTGEWFVLMMLPRASWNLLNDLVGNKLRVFSVSASFSTVLIRCNVRKETAFYQTCIGLK